MPDDPGCSCCGSDSVEGVGEHEICSRCRWEDDPFQAINPDRSGGANRMSLNQARLAFGHGRLVE
ncbi:CPCC family cysteine-rich protein [Pectobacterium carotovorum]|uniref:CPCC family cysteine-rich protein n=1 Tax=Pectobacterium carotovorum TaxID=554 RepID=UPI0029DB1C28|nr:CPCC family cysteine-rich protein [Pectobacterium carotovorum]MDX6916008.1 CPCC family cysteine-rich protein [Pectobacterium carotovorum]